MPRAAVSDEFPCECEERASQSKSLNFFSDVPMVFKSSVKSLPPLLLSLLGQEFHPTHLQTGRPRFQ